jgi:hypothetical protein
MDLIVLFGPPASGKMAVGRELAARTRYRLFHNHMTIEPLLGLFHFGHPAFNRLSGGFRRQILHECLAADEFDLVFTFVWALDDDRDEAFLRSLAHPVEQAGGTVRYVELVCSQTERLRRNRTPLRLDMKRTKRDVDWSDDNLRKMDVDYRTTSRPGEMARRVAHYLRVDNEHVTASTAAERIATAFALPGEE